ncbi:hypothetical protein [Actinophytocola sp.]|uniref:hypothetical protein n=1 Tax=Actinophytocola sp. TaxID=1872138 RepID=UPI003D6C353D
MLPGLVSPVARDLVFRDVAQVNAELVIWERERNLETLSRECGSVTRLLVGFLAWALAILGGVGLVLAAWDGVARVSQVLGLVAGLLVLGAALLLGFLVWRTGRAVVDAYCWWELLPSRLRDELSPQLRATTLSDIVETRIFMLRGPRLVRTIVASAAFLGPFVLLLLATEDSPRFDALWPSGQGPALLVAVLVAFAACWTVGAVVLGGQVRANWAQSQRDPVQSWILATTGRLFRGR